MGIVARAEQGRRPELLQATSTSPMPDLLELS